MGLPSLRVTMDSCRFLPSVHFGIAVARVQSAKGPAVVGAIAQGNSFGDCQPLGLVLFRIHDELGLTFWKPLLTSVLQDERNKVYTEAIENCGRHVTNFHNAWKLFLYAGLEKEEYEQLRPSIHEENRGLLDRFSLLAAVMFFLLLIVSMLSHGFAAINGTAYLLCGIEMLVILFCSRFVLTKHPALVILFVYVFEITLYVFGIHISMLHADKPAVSAVAFLLVSPLLFYDRPIRLSALIAVVVAVFCGIVVRFKAPDVAESDVWNMITFGIVAVATTVFMMSIKIRALAQSRQIEYMGQTDLLTGAKNRNHYESRLQGYPNMCASNLSCVYADVNGLHEMNNRDGHAAGDKMLCEVAEAMQQRFGQEHTYRIGGDEFVAFRVDGRLEDLPSEIDQLRRLLSQKGYHVSFGIATHENAQGEPNMRDIVNAAEIDMFADKREFYRRSENDRRSR
jgi:diguanylate cyclase (GGDEF)-like protein